MSECLITSLEDVLAMDANNAWARNVKLYNALGGHFRTVLTTRWERDEAKRWLRAQQVRYDLLLDRGSNILDAQAWKVHCVREVMAMGWPVGLYLDADPAVVQEVLGLGLTTLLVSFRVKRPSWVPTGDAPRQWDELVSFIDEQRDADGVAREQEGIGGRRRGGWPGDVQADPSQ